VSPLVFLGIALGLSLLGALVLWMMNRPPKSVDAHIRAFSRELEALAPDPQALPPRKRTTEPRSSPPPPGLPGPPGPPNPQPKRGRRSG
jgi:hypothetical protein